MLYRATSSITSRFSDKMSASVPVEVGTRGTVGSLLKKEIEYFRRLEPDCRGSSNNKPQKSTVEINSGGSSSWPSFGFLTMKWRKKKRRGSGGGLPAMCSMVEVSENSRMYEIPGFSYRNLKVDSKRFEEEVTLS
ncbi:PREDICTED: uncharacterized protein LOC109230086 [Nicotiana attenuata]|uniref:Uncharacterized protein n=1 Tax=Nicotiana attenuata TaxID=49451 RepID=A0A1J6IJN4_NICAT|nr:PREDICTED: uncharacterized protein LOC109230086 [Nicotiana attenuata]OIT00744.1 hypothetical protein A4A49_07515 [Nicotiana attenuata]